MFNSTRDHFVQNVLVTYQEFCERRHLNQLGVNALVLYGVRAAGALYHMREHVSPKQRPTTAALLAQCPDYALARDVANTSKHKTITRYVPIVTDAKQIFEVAVITRFRDDEGEYSYAQAEVIVRLDDGSERRLADILYNVMVMWCDQLRALGIVDAKDPTPMHSPNAHVPRDVAKKDGELALRITQGEGWQSQFRLRRFNYEKNASEPLDLPGANVRFNIYKPIESVPISMSLAPDHAPTDFDIPLTPDQSREYMHLNDGDGQITYLKMILESTPHLKNAFLEKYAAEHPGALRRVVLLSNEG